SETDWRWHFEPGRSVCARLCIRHLSRCTRSKASSRGSLWYRLNQTAALPDGSEHESAGEPLPQWQSRTLRGALKREQPYANKSDPTTVERQPNRLSADRNQSLTFVFPITYNEQRLVRLGSR